MKGTTTILGDGHSINIKITQFNCKYMNESSHVALLNSTRCNPTYLAPKRGNYLRNFGKIAY